MNWQKIWNSRDLKSIENRSSKEVLESLLKMDGFDSPTGNIDVSDWVDYLNHITEVLELEDSDSLYEVGCGSGAFLYSYYKRNHRVAGLDFSNDLISIAKKAMPKMTFDTQDAIELKTTEKFDVVLASSVVFYFPSYKYTQKVLELMIKKANKSIAILDVPDIDTREQCELFRRGTLSESEYKIKYDGLMHLYYPKNFWIEFAEFNNMKYRIEQQNINGYCNNEFRYNVFLFKGE